MFSNKKYFLLLLLFILIILAVVFKPQKSTLNKSEKVFVYNNSSNADRIEIATTNNNFQLSKVNGIWYTSDNNTVSPKMTKQFFQVLENLQIQSPVLKTDKEKLLEELDKQGVNIKILSNGKLKYNLNLAEYASKHFASSARKNLYYITVRGGKGNVFLGRLINTKISDWYDKILINLNSEEITDILLEYSDKTENGFIINNQPQAPILKDKKRKAIENTDSESLKDYLHFFSGIKYAIIDTTVQIPNPNKQLFRLNINTNISKKIQVVGFEMVAKKTLQPDTREFVGVVNNSLLVKLSYSDFDPILVERDYFLKK